ncbi:MAG: hypothetical protein LBN27_05965 [Prevotellaceae bacterium]|jgi:hypothetical protein|nr:hypothetical protein [Prevotellaceae bacterium]
MEFWTDFYKEIAEKITTNLPKIKWVDLWHEQVNYLTEELPFPTPAVFIGFSTTATDDIGTLAQQCAVQIDMYLFYETFSDTYEGSSNQEGALAFLNNLTELYALFHGKAGQNFSAMRRVDMHREDSGGAGNLYRISFECLVTDYAAQILFVESENPQAEVDVSADTIPPPEQGDEPLYHL